MSGFFTNAANVARKMDRHNMSLFSPFDPISAKMDLAAQNFIIGRPHPGTHYYGEPSPGPPGPPTQDTAANNAEQQANDLRRRRGVLANIYAGNSAPAPQVASKSVLGN